VLEAGLGDLSSQALCDLRRLSDAAAIGDQAWYIRAGCELATFFQRLDMQADCDFCHLGTS